MAVRERAALRVLAGEPDRHAFGEEGRERERLGLRPVDPALLAERLAPALELLGELGVDGEAVGDGEQLARSARSSGSAGTARVRLLAAGAAEAALLRRHAAAASSVA